MKLVLREYIKLLKEDKELDSLLTNLLFYMDIEPKSRPQRGRQYGVDIMGVGIDPDDNVKKLFILTVKQGDLNRRNWDSNENAIRASLNEIFEVYIPNLINEEEKKLPKKVIVAFNGIMEQTVRNNWNGYKDKIDENEELIDWDLEKIVLLVEQYLFNESILPSSTSLILRKAISFIDLNDYDFKHIEELFQKILYEDTRTETKAQVKKIKLLNISLNILFKWAEREDNIKNVMIAAEKAILFLWDYQIKAVSLEQKEIQREFYIFLISLANIQDSYLKKTHKYCLVKDSLAYTARLNHSEYCLISFEYIGFLAISGLLHIQNGEMFLTSGVEEEGVNNIIGESISKADVTADFVVNFIKNNSSVLYPQYDEHCIEVCLILMLLHTTNRYSYAQDYLERLINNIIISYRTTKFFPLFYANHDNLIDTHVHNKKEKQESSILLTCLLEWCIVVKHYKMYDVLKDFIKNDLKDINLQLWFPDSEIEKHLFVGNADREGGKTKFSIEVYENRLEYEAEMVEELQMERLTPNKDLTIFKYGMGFLGLLASRHYRTLVFPSYWRNLLQSKFCFNNKN